MKRIVLASIAVALSLTPSTRAQHSPVDMAAAVTKRFDSLPDRLGDLPRVDGGYDKPMAAYRGKANLDPVIVVVVSAAGKPASWRDLAELGRSSAIQAHLIDTLFEGKFSSASHAGAISYFGDYLTDQGIKQSWIVDYGGVRMTVLATIYRTEDRRRVFDSIRRDLLGGAILANVTPAEAN